MITQNTLENGCQFVYVGTRLFDLSNGYIKNADIFDLVHDMRLAYSEFFCQNS